MEQNSKLDLAGEIFLVNKIIFLVTLGERINFTTVDNLKDYKATTIISRLKLVINFYKNQSFTIKTMFTDNYFEVLDSGLKI